MRRSIKLISASLLLSGFCVSVALLLVLSVDTKQIDINTPSSDQFSWGESTQRCTSLSGEWRLPSIIELFALNYFDDRSPFIPNTDYWSRDSYLGYAFGLNTHRGIASFDRHADTDHFICVRKLKRPA